MAFLSNQWLNKGQSLFERKYHPVPIEVTAVGATDDWSREHNVSVELQGERANGEYQVMLLTTQELDRVLEVVIDGCSETARKHIAARLLRTLSDTELVALLAQVLKSRA